MNVHVDVEEGADHSMKAIQWSEHPPGLFKMARRKHFTLYTTVKWKMQSRSQYCCRFKPNYNVISWK
ncbi:hypothetical protein T4E_11342 [Trichinella pseudospiralis]|uniref:Uncharacterized protein n=1 Tax=Trichinella pseudospiralis TaxID=6337 RepID=A0A0V0XRC0_TRIPS|nr:hypothetical protein T4E_2367 [Trichinella pseudospiralis]KRX90544.1 hypothetical protein T4E_11342 [Trichinella pseudospiralis]